ncbi:MAG: ABC transporter ATP-binding protein [Thalassobaculales bacterium]
MAEATGRLELSGVAKSYGAVSALADVDLAIAPGEFVSLLGPSGCGKTTLLRCVAGLIAPDRGRIAVDGRTLDGVPPWKRDIGVVFQNYALFPHMDVAANVGFGLKMRRLAPAAIAARVERALSLVHMEGFAGRYPAQLSGGQQQRVALARAIAIEPAVLLLDEPMAALDARLRAAMQLELRRLQSRLGITTVLVTHDQTEAMTMSDRIAVMNAGRIEQVAAPGELYRRPASVFVAEFVGETNRLPGRAEATGFLADAAPGAPLALDRPAPLGPALLLLLRPEAIRLSAAPGDNRLDGVVTDVIMVGSRTSVFVDVGGQVLHAALATGSTDAGLPAQGERVTLAWPPSAAMVFPLHTQ